jgi:hypothetical protein
MLILIALVRDTKFVRQHYFLFFIETLLMGFIGAAPLFLMSYYRREKHEIDAIAIKEFFIIALKLMGIHLLLQFSGCYTVWFPNYCSA